MCCLVCAYGRASGQKRKQKLDFCILMKNFLDIHFLIKKKIAIKSQSIPSPIGDLKIVSAISALVLNTLTLK